MPHLSTRDPLARTPGDDPTPTTGPVEGATLRLEAPSAEAAFEELHARLGVDARVVAVRRVHRGGIGGFFAREVVELHAAPRGTSPVDRLLATDDAAATGHASAAPVRTLAATDEVDFATFLRAQLDAPAGPGPAPDAPDASDASDAPAHEALVARATAIARAALEPAAGGVVDPAEERSPATAVQATAVQVAAEQVAAGQVAAGQVAAPLGAPPTARVDDVDPSIGDALGGDLTRDVAPGDELGDGPPAAIEDGPAWSVPALVKLGLPAGLVRGLEVADPHDDVAWTAALAAALRPVCRPLPSGRSLLVGPRARRIGGALGVPVTAVGQPIRSRARTVAAAVGSGVAGRRWLERARGTRWLHLVVGGAGWRELVHLDVLAVSWATAEDLPEAVRLATELGLVLGAGPVAGTVRRARPLDVALGVRDLLPTR